MHSSLQILDFLSQSEGQPLVDVRSPAEFALGHLPGAVSIPLFDDHERAEIGTLYKIKGKDEAVERGLEIVSPKLAGFVKRVKEISAERKVFVYCWRGGMRSNSFAWLMNSAGLNAFVLSGGYKSFRNHVLSTIDNTAYNLVLIGGSTGSGKSAVLRELVNHGEQILDLERLANHKGSAFGSINERPQLPQQQFEHQMFFALQKLDPKKRIWVEDEAMAIGWNKIPHPFWKQMKKAPVYKLNVPFDIRVHRLVEDYRTTNIELLRKPLLAIQKKLGGQHLKAALDFLDAGQLDKVAAIALNYYDEAYRYNIETRNQEEITEVNTESGDPVLNAQILLKAAEKKFLAAVSK